MSHHNFQSKSNFFTRIALPFFIAVFASAIISNPALAANDAITQVLCNVVATLQGTMGKAIATIGICVLGIGLFLGKLNWAVGIATAIGIGLIFGASSFISWVASGSTFAGTDATCNSGT